MCNVYVRNNVMCAVLALDIIGNCLGALREKGRQRQKSVTRFFYVNEKEDIRR